MKSEKLARIADILPPPEPVATADTAWITIFLLLAIPAIIVWLMVARTSIRAQRTRLRRHFEQQKINSRQLATMIEKLLCRQYELERIDPSFAPAGYNARHWRQLATSLHSARFSRHSLNADHMFKLLDKIDTLLEQAHE